MQTRSGVIGPMVLLAVVLVAGQSVEVVEQAEDGVPARAPVPSEGCGAADIDAGSLRGQPLVVGDDERAWRAFVPQAHDGTSPVPLWVQLHGKGGASVTELSRFRSTAETNGFVVVAPDGKPGNPRWLWQKEDSEVDLTHANPDIAFIEALLDHLGEVLCLDLARIYAGGDGQGGYLVDGLACVLEDRFAAVATTTGMFDLGERCALERPVPRLHAHGRADRYALFDGGFSSYAAGLPVSGDGEAVRYGDHPIIKALGGESIPTRMARVAARNGCEPEPTIEAIDEGMERWIWDCPTGAEVEFLVHDGGDAWPRDAPVSINERIWEFFEQHPMPAD